ncbi:MAG: hypothetical protein IT477_10295 [Rhodanobacteraceae bacterium]|nr:hypothetical protein [Rhodanobacteraceae bacterium]
MKLDLGTAQQLLQKVRQAQADSGEGFESIPGYDEAALRDVVLDGLADGQLSAESTKKYLQTFFAVGAGAVCGAVSGGALAPLCAGVGKVIGGIVAEATAKPVHPNQESEIGKILDATKASDFEYLKQVRDRLIIDIYGQLPPGDEEARQQAKRLIEGFFPFEVINWCNAWNYRAGYIDQLLAADFGPGFLVGFEDPCCLLQSQFHDNCTTWFEWEIDYSAPWPKAMWVENYLGTNASILKKKGIDVGPEYNLLVERATTEKRYSWPGITPGHQLYQVHQDIKEFFWPKIQAALSERLKDLLVASLVKAQADLAAAVDDLARAIAAEHGCHDDACLQPYRKVAVAYSKQVVASGDVDAVAQKLVQEQQALVFVPGFINQPVFTFIPFPLEEEEKPKSSGLWWKIPLAAAVVAGAVVGGKRLLADEP